MKGDIALVGFVLTAAEWHGLDTSARKQLLAAAFHRDEASVKATEEPSPRTGSGRARR